MEKKKYLALFKNYEGKEKYRELNEPTLKFLLAHINQICQIHNWKLIEWIEI